MKLDTDETVTISKETNVNYGHWDQLALSHNLS